MDVIVESFAFGKSNDRARKSAVNMADAPRDRQVHELLFEPAKCPNKDARRMYGKLSSINVLRVNIDKVRPSLSCLERQYRGMTSRMSIGFT